MPFGSEITSPALRAIADHWNQARKGRKMPSWSELSPATMAPHLGMVWAFKYDRKTGDFIARLAGNRMMIGFGKSFRGTPLKELHQPKSLGRAHAILMRVVSEPVCYRSRGQLFKADGRLVEGERIMLPLGTDETGVDGALGASDYDGSFVVKAAREIELLEDDVRWFPV
jgi:hypothetical protein